MITMIYRYKINYEYGKITLVVESLFWFLFPEYSVRIILSLLFLDQSFDITYAIYCSSFRMLNEGHYMSTGITMEKKDKDILRRNGVELVQTLDVGDSLLAFLVGKHILTDEMEERIKVCLN